MNIKRKTQPESWKTTKKERKNYIIGDLARSLEGYIVTAFMSTFLIFQGIDLTAIAGAMLFVKIIDSLDDVLFGYLIDKIKINKFFKKITKDGKYLPWYRLTFLFFPFFTALFFLMPQSWPNAAKIAWYIVFYLLYDFSYTLVEVPMNSMIITITDNIEERKSLLQTKTILSNIGTMGAGIIWMFMISEYVGAPISIVALVSSGILLIFMIPLAFGVKEHNTELKNISENDEKYTFKDMIGCIKTNKYLFVILLSTFVSQCLLTSGAIGTFVSYYLFGSSMILVIPIFISLIPVIIAQSQVAKLTQKYGKKRVFLICGISGAIVYFSIYFIGINGEKFEMWQFILMSALLVIQSIPGNMSTVAKNFMLPDTIEYTRYKTGKDCSGICYSIQSFVTKFTSSIASSLGLFILGLSDWIPLSAESFEDVANSGIVQPASALQVLWIIYALIPSIGTLLGALIMIFYKLKDRDVVLMSKCNAGEITKEECEKLMQMDGTTTLELEDSNHEKNLE